MVAWWPCETFSLVLSHACAVQSTSISLSPTSQITEYYGGYDYDGLRWITANLELRIITE
jgi:hypothetical protein